MYLVLTDLDKYTMNLKDLMLHQMTKQLLSLCQTELEMEEFPEIDLIDDSTVGGQTSFGIFDGSIKVATRGRHPMDIMRTLAHELVHWKQMQMGQHLDGSDGSETENQANAIAGIVMRRFGHIYPEYFMNNGAKIKT